MTERIARLAAMTLSGNMYPKATPVAFDRLDLFLPDHRKNAKRIHDHIVGQTPIVTEYQTMTGAFSYTREVVGDGHRYDGHPKTNEALSQFYGKPLENLSTFEWQHATADFRYVVSVGVRGLKADIDKSRAVWQNDEERLCFLDALDTVADTMVEWAHICAAKAAAVADEVSDPAHKANLQTLAAALRKVPEHPAETFYEAVLSIYIWFNYAPDSLGTLDRTLEPYYRADLQSGRLTPDSAREMLQELFLSLQANTAPDHVNFTRGGESHFCVGGYNEQHQDVFSDFSLLILEALTDLPTFIPQVSLRWTADLPHETFRQVLDLCRKDQNKRIAFVNDEVKLHAATTIGQIPFEVACRYATVGCNEVAFPGGAFGGTTNTNLLRSVERVLHRRRDEAAAADTWEAFLALYRDEMNAELDRMIAYDDAFLRIRAKDPNYVTSLLFRDCVEKGRSFTEGDLRYAVGGVALIGLPNVIDSLAVIKQFVYDEKAVSMADLIDALKQNWQGYEELHRRILKTGHFFGNNDTTSDTMARQLTEMLYQYAQTHRNTFGQPLLFGNLEGYQPHHQWFGEGTAATPDGRRAGEAVKFGIGQSGGYDREGLSALLAAVAAFDPHGTVTGGPSVTNLSLDEQLVRNDESFDKLVYMLETYFRQGGSQFQLNYVSKEELQAAKRTPQEYKNLRVRVSGFSDFFVNLPSSTQDDIINRTLQRG